MELNAQEKTQANSLWHHLNIKVQWFNKAIRRSPKSDFFGYVGLLITADPHLKDQNGKEILANGQPIPNPMAGLSIFLNGLRVKRLPKGFYLEVNQESYKKDGETKFSEIFGPASKVMRAVLQTAVFQNPAIVEAIQECERMPVPTETSAANPGGTEVPAAGSSPFAF